MTLALRGSRTNRDAVGAVAIATVGTRRLVRVVKAGSGYLGQSDLRLHFGLGPAARVDRLEVRWPGGATEIVPAITAGQTVTIVEGRGIVEP